MLASATAIARFRAARAKDELRLAIGKSCRLVEDAKETLRRANPGKGASGSDAPVLLPHSSPVNLADLAA